MSSLEERIEKLSPAQRRLLEARLRRGDDGRPTPLSFAQERLWFLEQLIPDGTLYNITEALRFAGALDRAALQKALDALVARHGALRTTFRSHDGEPVQLVGTAQPVKTTEIDLTTLGEADREARARRDAAAEASRPFDLTCDPLLRVRLLRLEEQLHVVLLTTHHIVSDRWSRRILRRDLAELYNAARSGRPAELPLLSIDYTDHALRQRRDLRGPALESLLSYWTHALENSVATTVPGDAPPADGQDHRGDGIDLELDHDLSATLRVLGRRHRATPFMVLHAALGTLLARLSGRQDVVIGCPVAGRGRTDTEELIGLFVNTLALRTDVSGDPTFVEILARVRESTLGALTHQELPFERLVQELQPQRSLIRNPLFDVMLNFTSDTEPPPVFDGLALSLERLHSPPSIFSMTLYADDVERIRLRLIYRRALFSRERMQGLLEQYGGFLRQIVTDPERPIGSYSLVTDRARTVLPNPTLVIEARRHEPVPNVLARLARESADRPAVIRGGRSWTRGELFDRAEALARVLRARGVGPGDVVALTGPRSFGLIAGMLGVSLGGGVLLTIDPALPADRRRLMLLESGAQHMLFVSPFAPRVTSDANDDGESMDRLVVDPETGASTGGHLTDEAAREDLPAPQPDHPAYVFFTSGTTGVPSGVLGTHAGLAHFVDWQRREFDIGPSDRCAQLTSLSFDVLLRDVFLPLTSGGAICLPDDDETRLVPDVVLRWLDEQRVTVLHTVPSLALSWLAAVPTGTTLRSLRYTFLAGEPLTASLVRRWRRAFPASGRIVNLYGPTETTMVKCFHRVADDPAEGVQSIGVPIPDTQALILDRGSRLCGIGEPGQIALRTPFGTRGYVNSPELTRRRFVPNPFRRDEEDRIYLTGDMGRYRPDGSLDILGRTDHQIKIRGVRVEPDEIDAVLQRHASVHQAVTVSRSDREGETFLASYVVAGDGDALTAEMLRGHLKDHLPESMIPACIVVVPHLPLTSNGKIDRDALPEPPVTVSATRYVAPSTPTERGLAEIWSQTLGLERVGVSDSFFDLGGHSLRAIVVLARIRETFGVEIPVRLMLESPTVAALAAAIDARGPAPEPRSVDRIPVTPRGATSPQSFAQKRLWLLEQDDSTRTVYNIARAMRLRGALDPQRLKRALAHVIERHESLRTTFESSDGEPVQRIHTAARPSLAIPLTDLRKHPQPERAGELQRRLTEETARPFDLGTETPLRAQLYRLDDEEYVFLRTIHHIACDGWSMGVIDRELTALYRADDGPEPAGLKAPEIQFADYSEWQRRRLDDPTTGAVLDGWERRLAGAPPLLELPSDLSRRRSGEYAGRRHYFEIPRELIAALSDVARKNGVTLFMALLAVFEILLARYTGQTDLVLGTPMANRNRPELRSVVGLLVNMLPIRCDLSGEPGYREVLRRVMKATREAMTDQELPFGRIVDRLRPPRRPGRNPIFQVAIALNEKAPADLCGLASSPVPVGRERSRFDLTLLLARPNPPESAAWEATFEYRTELLSPGFVRRMEGHFLTLLCGVLADRSTPFPRLPLLSEDEERKTVVDWNRTATPYPKDARIEELFRRQARARPEQTAVVFDEERMTYGVLNERAEALAAELRHAGIGPGATVAIHLDRGVGMVVAMLGILEVGAVYVPLDTSYPASRMAHMLADARVSAVVAARGAGALSWSGPLFVLDASHVVAEMRGEPAEPDASCETTGAYVIYTSGSAGGPKGTVVPHRAVIRLVRDTDYVELGPDDRVAQASNASFDAATFEIWGALLNGGTLVGMPRETVLSPTAFAEKLRKERVTTLFVTTALFNVIAREQPEAFAPLKQLLFGGEAVDPEAVRLVLAGDPPARLLHVYGPTENTTFSTWYEVRDVAGDAETIPIGRPVANTTAYVLDEFGNAVPPGVPGELFLGGDGLACGYLRRDELNRRCFVPDPFSDSPGGRLYRTGDRVRKNAQGQIEFIGRLDRQVKLRGFRIELEEIESALAGHTAVRDAAVELLRPEGRDKQIVAWIVTERGHDLDAATLRAELGKSLPGFMIPSSFVFLDSMPLTPNGKVDRSALPDPAPTESALAPRNDLERQLAAIWQVVLAVEPIGVRDGFFDLGGDSLLGAQLLARIEERYGKELPVATLQEAQTIEALAGVLRKKHYRSPLHLMWPLKPSGERRPLFCVHGAMKHVASDLHPQQPFYVLVPHGHDGHRAPESVQEMARDYLDELQHVQPRGPYLLAGYSAGGVLAFEMACQLQAAGREVDLLLLIDPTPKDTLNKSREDAGRDTEFQPDPYSGRLRTALKRFVFDHRLPRRVTLELYHRTGRKTPLFLRGWYYRNAAGVAVTRYTPGSFRGRTVMLRTGNVREKNPAQGWERHIAGPLEVLPIPGTHRQITTPPHAAELARRIQACLDSIRRSF